MFKEYQSLNFQVTEILQWFYKEINQFINLHKKLSSQRQRQNQEQIDKIQHDLEQYKQKLTELEKQLQVYKQSVLKLQKNDNQNDGKDFSLCFSQLSKQLDKGINHYKKVVLNVN
ncbi:hypothetical protein PPERSA_11055 [Pseudocohnilembus persalinus]|uniref:Uncharacterized protein n=1 Tax=Pseudocohnilembus persalinus TaxID=266149 RepID=A0A0V0QZ12_PSEPJ|nr:hypothetical protein PPERSA_11055 [Pseudocohnilembus persalinus]|eukprot:KRX07506.1 hypothetical protein PPERSA_11055 [Pseudocohnilembus persalinus]